MKFKYPFRKYQNLILARFTRRRQDGSYEVPEKKMHIVAPPGSGKTIVGLELINRIGEPAVIFSPNSTVAHQWREKTGMFLPESLKLSDIATTNSKNLKLVNSFTYQLISSQKENLDYLHELAIFKWALNLQDSNIVNTIEEAEEKIADEKKSNPRSYNKSIQKYYKIAKRDLLESGEINIKDTLHENAKQLIESLKSHGVNIIVLDEAHHLLDYWAMVLKALVEELGSPYIIGLTATPPIDVQDKYLDNYTSILGGIDFEIPTPAVVKEGNLAPYQDLVYFTSPTKTEKSFIENIQQNFIEYITEVTQTNEFMEWYLEVDWMKYVKKNPALLISSMRFANKYFDEPPNGMYIFEQGYKELEIDDWANLLTEYYINYLTPQNRTSELKKIKSVLKDFGYIVNERGLRQYRSIGDKILSISSSKTEAVMKILTHEYNNIGEDLRAVVITDFADESLFSKKNLEDIVDSGSGGAIFNYHRIVHDRTLTELESILITGKRVLIDEDEAELFSKEIKNWREQNKLDFEFSFEKLEEYEHILEVKGEGSDWRSNTYVLMVTDFFDKGITKCLVGTRGLLAEGWDTLSLNTLIDLTSATTNTSVNQIRGRSLRINPQLPKMVSNNWNICCVDTEFEKGDNDFKRLKRKHSRFFGLGENQKIVKGIAHLDEKLNFKVSTDGFKRIDYEEITEKMLQKSTQREQVYEDWQIGSEYKNYTLYETKIAPKNFDIKTSATIRTRINRGARLGLESIGSFVAINIVGFYFFVEILPLLVLMQLLSLIHPFINLSVYLKEISNTSIKPYIRDIAASIIFSLHDIGKLDKKIGIGELKIDFSRSDNAFNLVLEKATTEQNRIFTKAVNQVFEPINNQRYLVEIIKDQNILKNSFPFSRVIFNVGNPIKKNYFPVPKIFAVNRKRAEIFQKYWSRYVGGRKLIYTRNSFGSQILLQNRSKKYQPIKRNISELWV